MSKSKFAKERIRHRGDKTKKIDRVHLLKTISGDDQTKNATEINRKSNELFSLLSFFCKQKTLDALNNKNTF
jgi:hypothetical protein